MGEPWAGWGSIPAVFFPGQVTRVPPYVRSPFPSKENRQISERDDLGPPVVPGMGVMRSVGDPETFACHMAKWRAGIVLAGICWSPCAQRRCYPTGRCAYRPSVTS